jgi:hypothetical protein
MLVEISVTDIILICALPICAIVNYLLGKKEGLAEGAMRTYDFLEENGVIDEEKMETLRLKIDRENQ